MSSDRLLEIFKECGLPTNRISIVHMISPTNLEIEFKNGEVVTYEKTEIGKWSYTTIRTEFAGSLVGTTFSPNLDKVSRIIKLESL